ncbi:MAG: DegT/DnrJ/EryC1/StrS family aminotransferase [Chloroflexi bacterium]|nr:DegT/DnrJ/EryC1/StrS family aminotransferase [Chloroflexota bacterium]
MFRIPFVDLLTQHTEIQQEVLTAVTDIITRSCFVGGDYVAAFEQEFATYLGVREVIAVANGTDALWLPLLATGVGANDAVITVPNTFIATVEAITRTGARPLFVDVDPHTSHMNLAALATLLDEMCTREDDGRLIHRPTGRRVAAILPVHLYGLPVDMDELMALADQYDLPVIEDACQAHGAKYCVKGEWRRVGSVGLAAAFSFYPTKNLGAMGDGGAIATNDSELATYMRWLRDHGSSEKYIHRSADGWNSRLDAIQAAALSIKLKRLDGWNEGRQQAAACYRDVLSGLPLNLPVETASTQHVYHLFVVSTPYRDLLREKLTSQGIGAAIHYPIPLHLQEAYREMNLGRGSFPQAENLADTILSLPMYPGLQPEQIECVGQICAEALAMTNGHSAGHKIYQGLG